jgi:hypothetical protein
VDVDARPSRGVGHAADDLAVPSEHAVPADQIDDVERLRLGPSEELGVKRPCTIELAGVELMPCDGRASRSRRVGGRPLTQREHRAGRVAQDRERRTIAGANGRTEAFAP